MKRAICLFFVTVLATLFPLMDVRAANSPHTDSSAKAFQSQDTLYLTIEDSGRTFNVRVGTVIVVSVPTTPDARVYYDPVILQQYTIYDSIYYGWRFLAIREGISPLTISIDPPCYYPPCPMMPSLLFSVTIVVNPIIYPPPPIQPPPVIPTHTDVYIGTAYLDQTVKVHTGQIITLELPYLSTAQRVNIQFDRSVLSLISGQSTDFAPPGGWRFQALRSGTTTITVQGTDKVYFRVRIVVEP
jgi:hypothetical protein